MNKSTYNLMNKDILILQFNIITGEIINQTESSIPYYLQRLINNYDGDPDGELPIITWIKSRIRFYCLPDRSAEYLYTNVLNIHTLSEAADKMHCISMNDTFWVKRADSKTIWSSVSPFQNIHSKLISTYTLNGGNWEDYDSLSCADNKEKREDFNCLSPLPSTRGSFPHAWYHIPNHFHGTTVELKYIFQKGSSKYKFRSDGDCIEPYGEYFTSQIAAFLGFNHVDYQLIYHHCNFGCDGEHSDILTECVCYTTEETGSIAAKDLGFYIYEEVIGYIKENLSEWDLETFIDMLFLDCLTLNYDRHLRNIEFFMNNDNLDVVGLVPIFDNNKSFSFIADLDANIWKQEDWNKIISTIRKLYKASGRKNLRELFTLVCKYKSYEAELQKLKKYKISLDGCSTEVKKHLDKDKLEYINFFLQNQIRYLLRVDREIQRKRK